MNNKKTDPQGRQWSTYEPIPGLTPVLPWDSWGPEVWDWTQDHACRVRNEVAQGVPLPWEPFETLERLLERAGEPDPGTPAEVGLIWAPIIHRYPHATPAQALAEFVGMDGPALWAHEIIGFATRNELETTHALPMKRGDWDFATSVFEAAHFLMGGRSPVSIGGCEHIVFSEKTYGEKDAGGRRPGLVVVEQSGMSERITTAYPNGCPPFGAVPQGHASFMAYICERASQFWPDGRDEFTHAARVGGISREYAFVHGPLDTVTGCVIGRRAAAGVYDDRYPQVR